MDCKFICNLNCKIIYQNCSSFSSFYPLHILYLLHSIHILSSLGVSAFSVADWDALCWFCSSMSKDLKHELCMDGLTDLSQTQCKYRKSDHLDLQPKTDKFQGIQSLTSFQNCQWSFFTLQYSAYSHKTQRNVVSSENKILSLICMKRLMNTN